MVLHHSPQFHSGIALVFKRFFSRWPFRHYFPSLSVSHFFTDVCWDCLPNKLFIFTSPSQDVAESNLKYLDCCWQPCWRRRGASSRMRLEPWKKAGQENNKSGSSGTLVSHWIHPWLKSKHFFSSKHFIYMNNKFLSWSKPAWVGLSSTCDQNHCEWFHSHHGEPQVWPCRVGWETVDAW